MMAWPQSWLFRIMDNTASYLRWLSASLNWYSLGSICRRGGGGRGGRVVSGWAEKAWGLRWHS